MKLIKISLFILLFVSMTFFDLYAQDKICFTKQDSAILVVELERAKLLEENITLLEKSNEELKKQSELLKEQVNLLNEKFQAASNLLDKNEELCKQKHKLLEEELKQSKKDNIKNMFISGGIGAVAGAILVLVALIAL